MLYVSNVSIQEDIMVMDFSLSSARAKRSGCVDTNGFGGKPALRFNNSGIGPAQDWVYLPGAMIDAYSFTVRIWVRGENGGCHDYCTGSECLPIADSVDPAAFNDLQNAHTSILFSTGTFNSRRDVGLTVAHLAPHGFLTVQFLPYGGKEPIQFTGHKVTYDGRWHMVTVTGDRAGDLCLYIDDRLADKASIASWKGLSCSSASFTVGSDIKHEHGFGPGELADFSLDFRVMPADEIAHLYAAKALRLLIAEIDARGLDSCPIYDHDEAAAFLEKAHSFTEDEADPQAALAQLRKIYEEFLMRTIKPDLKLIVTSDLHCDGEDGGRIAAFRKGLAWANELGMDALVDGGDYSNFGKDFELDSFWRSLDLLWQGKPVFGTVGNHETLELKAPELVRYQCEHLHKIGMVDAGHNRFYYSGDCRGYHFVVLAQYSDTYTVTGYKGMWAHAGAIKEDQLDFVRRELDAHCGKGKPVFLVIHNAVEPLLARETNGHYNPSSACLIDADALYPLLNDHPDVIIFTGHVHHGFGGGAGFHHLEEENYNVIDLPGFRAGTIGYCIDDRAPVGSRHPAYFLYLFGKILLLRAADFATGEWLTAYDQTITLPEG